MKKLFKNKNYFLLFQGSLVSAIGTSLYSFASGLYVQDLFGEEGGAIYLALFMAVSVIMMVLFSPLAGMLADKVNKIRILYVTDFIRGFIFFGTLYILRLGIEKEILIWYLLGATALASLNQAFFGPASTAVIPEVVGEELIQQATGANSIIQSIQTIFGIIAGMFLYALVGFEVAVLVNAISFMFSGLSEMFIRTHYKNTTIAPTEKKSFLSDIKFGFKYLISKQGLLTMMMFSLVLNFCFSPFFGVGIPYLFRTELGASEYEIGIIDIVFSITSLVAGIIVGNMKLKSLHGSVKKGLSLMTLSFVISTILIIFVTYGMFSYWVFYGFFIASNILMGFTLVYTNVPVHTGLMKAIEPSVRGRVFATVQALSMGAIPIATLAAGFVINASNVALLGIILSVILFITTISMIPNKKVKLLFDNIKMDEEKIKTNQSDVSLQASEL